MLHELNPTDYDQVRHLFAEWRQYLVTFAVIGGDCPGAIVVDDRNDPRTALLWEQDEGELFLAGDPHNRAFNHALNDYIRHQIRPYAQTHLSHLSEYTLHCNPERWAPAIDAILAHMDPMVQRRRLYILQRLRQEQRAALADGYTLARIDAQILQGALNGVDILHEWVLRPWRSAADFLRAEVGYCLVHAEELVGWCVSEHTRAPLPGQGRACEIGIYTSEEYRRRGFATQVALATIEHCLAQGIEPVGWHCWGQNVASAATAEAVGFELAADRPVYNGCFNRFDNLLLQAYYHAQAQRTADALELWERGFEMWEAGHPEALSSPHCRAHPDTIAACYYAAGRARAQRGHYGAALRHLNRAVDNGWRDAARLQADPALAALRDSVVWQALLDRL